MHFFPRPRRTEKDLSPGGRLGDICGPEGRVSGALMGWGEGAAVCRAALPSGPGGQACVFGVLLVT